MPLSKRVLLDLHSFLWLQVSPQRFRHSTLRFLEDPATEIRLSVASAWEIAMRHELGELTLPEPPLTYVPSRMERCGIHGLAVELRHVLAAASLPKHHDDPFDRLLVAQAQSEGLALLTANSVFARYDVQLMAP